LSEFKKLLLEKFSEEEAERKIGMIDKSKNILRMLITSGYWDIINYMMKKVGKPESPEVYVMELHEALGMETGDIWHKLKMLEKLGIVKYVGKRPATPKNYRGGRPRQIYVINTDLWEWNELGELLALKCKYEEPVAEKLQKKLEKWIKQRTIKDKTEVNEF
jgi:hypothetical protein